MAEQTQHLKLQLFLLQVRPNIELFCQIAANEKPIYGLHDLTMQILLVCVIHLHL